MAAGLKERNDKGNNTHHSADRGDAGYAQQPHLVSLAAQAQKRRKCPMLLVTELAPGDRVFLSCPKSRNPLFRLPAVFEGFESGASLAKRMESPSAIVQQKNPFDQNRRYAVFLYGSNPEAWALFKTDDAGGITDDENRPINIHSRARAGRG
jgi:hypothetical protein